MSTSDRRLIDVWMADIEARMLALSMRCQERSRYPDLSKSMLFSEAIRQGFQS